MMRRPSDIQSRARRATTASALPAVLAAAAVVLIACATAAAQDGVTVERLGARTTVKKSKCTHCGACIAHCPTQALYADKEMKVHFVRSRCIACGLCVPTCPYDAIEMSYADAAT